MSAAFMSATAATVTRAATTTATAATHVATTNVATTTATTCAATAVVDARRWCAIFAGPRAAGTGYIVVNLIIATTANLTAAAARKAAAIGHAAATAVIASAALFGEAMAAPAVAIAPAGPRAHAQEDAVIEVSRPVKSIGRAGVWSIVVISVRASGLHAQFNDDLSLSRRRQDQAS